MTALLTRPPGHDVLDAELGTAFSVIQHEPATRKRSARIEAEEVRDGRD